TFHRLSRVPKGFRNKAQGCEERATLGKGGGVSQPQRGCGQVALPSAWPATLSGLSSIGTRDPRVARSSHPWALLQNPFGILPPGSGVVDEHDSPQSGASARARGEA